MIFQRKDINIAEKTIRISATLQRLRDTDPDGVSRTKILIGTPKSDTYSSFLTPFWATREGVMAVL